MISRRKLLTGAAALAACSNIAHADGISGGIGGGVGGGIGGVRGGTPFVPLSGSVVDMSFTTNQFFGASLANLSVTRAQTVSSFVDNPDGTVTAFAANTPRIAQGVGLLIEEARTNLLLQSDNLANAAWSLLQAGSGTASITANAGTAPDGTNSAALLTLGRSATTDVALINQTFTATATFYSGSVYVKAATNADIGNSISIQFSQFGGGGTPVGSNIRAILTGAWQRITVSAVLAATPNYQLFIGYNLNDGVSTGATNILVWRGQSELGIVPTSGIPTTTAPVTRNADVITMTGPILTAYKAAAVTQYVKTTNVANFFAGGAPQLVAFSPAGQTAYYTAANQTTMYIGSGPNAESATVGNSVTIGDSSLLTSGPIITVSSYSASGDSIVSNGGTETTSARVMPSPTSVSLGNQGGAFFLNGYISRLALWNSQLASATRIALSQTFNLTTPTVGGQAAQYLVPTAPLNGKLIMYVHGAGDTLLWLNTNAIGTREALLRQGYILAGSAAAGDNWGNQAGLDSYTALYNDILTRFPSVSKIMMYAGSMGGMCSLLTIGNNTFPVKAWYGVFPVTNLAAEYALSFTAAINTAYNIPGGGSYATQTAGHDPNLLSGSLYTLPMRFTASPSDTTVPKTQNTDLEAAKVAATTPEHFVLTSFGAHGDASNFMPSDVVSFFGRY